MLPERYVREIHARLMVRYGSKWSAAWDGIDSAAIVADWQQVLSGMAADEIRRALDSLPDDWPPTAPQFRQLGYRPEAHMPAIPPPPADRAGLKRIAQALQDGRKGLNSLRESMSPRQWAIHCLRERIAAGNSSEFQREALRKMEGESEHAESASIGQFNPIPDHLLPPGMRNNGIVLDHCRDLVARAQLGEYVPPDRLALAQSMLRRAEMRQETTEIAA